MKRKIMIVLLIVLLCGLCALCTAESSDLSSGDYSYAYLEDGTICITAYHGSDAKINVPAYMDGGCVTQIGEMAFAEYEVPSITSVTLPDTSLQRLHKASKDQYTGRIDRIGRFVLYGLQKAVQADAPCIAENDGDQSVYRLHIAPTAFGSRPDIV